MDTLSIELENCYGINKFVHTFEFQPCRSYAIYAPNGVMKSSFTKVFEDISKGKDSCDRIYTDRVCKRVIVDQAKNNLVPEQVLAICPYDETFSHSEKTSTLLVDQVLRSEYELLLSKIEQEKDEIIQAIKNILKSKRNIEQEISISFTGKENEILQTLINVENTINQFKNFINCEIPYDVLFDEKVIEFLGNPKVKAAIVDYLKRYNELISKSTFFNKNSFNYYNATNVAKSLSDNGFFKAKHSINLNSKERIEIKEGSELISLIDQEKQKITNDDQLRAKFTDVEKLIKKNVSLRDFEDYLVNHLDLVEKLNDYDGFRKEVFLSCFLKIQEQLTAFIVDFHSCEIRKAEIEKEAENQRTQWENVIDIFNSRFFVPFKLQAENRKSVILGKDPVLNLNFVYDDGNDSVPLDRKNLLNVLSTGEKKAFYILNVIFEVEARRSNNQQTLFIIDDIADSFDYKNKYAIIQYLAEIDSTPFFYQIILTHNFDLFRTLNSKFVNYKNCLYALKNTNEILLRNATGIKNIFVNDWKVNFYNDPLKKIASIPFIRNIIEFTRGEADNNYKSLTSMLHQKADSDSFTNAHLDTIFCTTFNMSGNSVNPQKKVIDEILDQANGCKKIDNEIILEKKIVLSIAIRLMAEKFMINRINDKNFVNSIKSNQTAKLFNKMYELNLGNQREMEILGRVLLMTSENIHLNSFMYEPLIDMSDEHLIKLFDDIQTLV